MAFKYQLVRLGILPKVLKRRHPMKKEEHLKYCKKVADVLGYERLNNLDKLQSQSLNNQLNDLIEEHDYIVETVTDDEIIGRYELVTEHIYPSDFVEMRNMIKQK